MPKRFASVCNSDDVEAELVKTIAKGVYGVLELLATPNSHNSQLVERKAWQQIQYGAIQILAKTLDYG